MRGWNSTISEVVEIVWNIRNIGNPGFVVKTLTTKITLAKGATMRWRLVLLALQCGVLLLGVTGTARSSTRASGLSYYDPLLYTQLIVRGTIEDTQLEDIRRGDWGSTPRGLEDGRRTIRVLRFRIREVLKGVFNQNHISVAMSLGGLDTGSLMVGDERILCLHFKKSLKGGSYFLRSGGGIFAPSTGGRWIRQRGAEAFSLSELRARIGTGKMEHVVREAEIIAVGTIKSRNMSPMTSPNNERLDVIEYTLQIEQLLKGNVRDQVTFKTIEKGLYSPDWRVFVPAGMKPGERWYVFLKKGTVGYYPFAGTNGLLKIEGQNLIYNNQMEYHYKKGELDKLITGR